MRALTLTAAAGLAAVASLGLVTPAQAGSKPVLDVVGLGTHTVDASGTAHVTGDLDPVSEPFAGAYVATLTPDDGSLPEPGVCEPASATLAVDGPKPRSFTLAGSGDVCGEYVTSTSQATHTFTGRYEVVDSSSRRLRGTDGFLGVTLATEARAHVFAVDT